MVSQERPSEWTDRIEPDALLALWLLEQTESEYASCAVWGDRITGLASALGKRPKSQGKHIILKQLKSLVPFCKRSANDLHSIIDRARAQRIQKVRRNT